MPNTHRAGGDNDSDVKVLHETSDYGTKKVSIPGNIASQ
jgi:hypothetical protein